KRRMHQHDERLAINARNRCYVADQIEFELVERCIDCVRICYKEKRVSISWRVDNSLRCEIATSADPVLGNEWLAETLRQPLADQARHGVGGAAGRKPDDDAHRPGRIGLRPRDARDHGRQSGTRSQMQKVPTGKGHGTLSWQMWR